MRKRKNGVTFSGLEDVNTYSGDGFSNLLLQRQVDLATEALMAIRLPEGKSVNVDFARDEDGLTFEIITDDLQLRKKVTDTLNKIFG